MLISKLNTNENNKEDEIHYDIIKMCIIFVISKINYELVLECPIVYECNYMNFNCSPLNKIFRVTLQHVLGRP